MKIEKFRIKNYKVFEDSFEIEFKKESITVILGTNNVGKSTILEAIDNFLHMKAPTYDNFNKNKLEIEGELFEFELTVGNSDKSTMLKTTYNKEGKGAKYYIDDNNVVKNKFKEFIDVEFTVPFYIHPDSSAEDNEKEILELFRETARRIVEDDPTELKKFIKIKDDIEGLINEATKAINNSIVDLINDINEDLKRIFGEKLGDTKIDVNSTEFTLTQYANLLNSNILFSKDNINHKLNVQGTGVRRAAFISLLHNAMRSSKLTFINNRILLVDEPEVFLHPMAVKQLSEILYDIAGDSLQIIVSTHSPVFVDLYKGLNKSLRILKVEKDAVELYSSEENDLGESDIENIKLLTLTNSYFNEFFFAKRILIVEGDSEYIMFNSAIQKYLLTEGKDELPTHIINAKGKWTITSIQKILNRFNAKYHVFHDLDTSKLGSENNLAQANAKILELAEKNSSSKIIANVETLEDTLYNKTISNSNKTVKSIELIEEFNSSEEAYSEPAKIIMNIVKWLYDKEVLSSEKIKIRK